MCGTMYLTCYNFPIEERYLPENILLFGIIPGPNHPSKVQGTAESFLRPLVDVGVSLGEQCIFFTARRRIRTDVVSEPPLSPS